MPKGVYVHKKGRIITWGDKISKSSKGKIFSETHKLNLSISHKGLPSGNKGRIGYKHTQEALQKISQTSKGNKHCLGRVLSDEHKMKISVANKGRIMSADSCNKIRSAKLGKKRADLIGENNPMHRHRNAYKSKYGKTGFRNDINLFVKSTWEANMYRIFSFLGMTIQYEPKSFLLSNGKTYRPDFFIVELNKWIEVKGRWLKDAKERFLLFKNEYSDINIQVIEKEQYKNYLRNFSKLITLER